MARLPVSKTYKLFINGQFPRTESGRYYEVRSKRSELLANVCLASRKDLRDAVVAARTALSSWSSRSAYNRSQILYRIAEMMEGRSSQFVEQLLLKGFSKKQANAEVQLSIDRVVYYAGWCDKYQQLLSSVNPVSSPHYNFSVPEPVGVVTAVLDEDSPLLGLVTVMCAIIAGANTAVLLAPYNNPLPAVILGEVLATSDLPAGVVNILTGKRSELLEHFSTHMDINTLVYCGADKTEYARVEAQSISNLKRCFRWDRDWMSADGEDPYLIMDLQEIKTTWHPIEQLGGGAGKY